MPSFAARRWRRMSLAGLRLSVAVNSMSSVLHLRRFPFELGQGSFDLARIEQNDPLDFREWDHAIADPIFQKPLGHAERFCHLWVSQSSLKHDNHIPCIKRIANVFK